MKRHRVAALVHKEWLDLRHNAGAMIPVLLTGAVALLLPFIIVLLVPAVTGERLSDDSDLVRVSAAASEAAHLDAEGRIQFFILQQFVWLFLLTPVTGATTLAAHSIVGEKQARTLEPLLATPIGTSELLLAKVLGALWPSLVVSMVSLMAYFAGIAWLAQPGVGVAMFNRRTLVLLLFVVPAASLVSLQAALIASSRVNDARTAQQISLVVIVPLTALLVAEFSGVLWLTGGALALLGVVLVASWVVLLLLSVVLFRRETILTRWR